MIYQDLKVYSGGGKPIRAAAQLRRVDATIASASACLEQYFFLEKNSPLAPEREYKPVRTKIISDLPLSVQ